MFSCMFSCMQKGIQISNTFYFFNLDLILAINSSLSFLEELNTQASVKSVSSLYSHKYKSIEAPLLPLKEAPSNLVWSKEPVISTSHNLACLKSLPYIFEGL